jgi:hypothetical protein
MLVLSSTITAAWSVTTARSFGSEVRKWND